MNKRILIELLCVLVSCNVASADTFGSGSNQFTIDFVPIQGDATKANGTNISQGTKGEWCYGTFSDPGDFRIGTFEITSDKWNKFVDSVGHPVTGEPGYAYNTDPYTGQNMPTNAASWYEAAQFVNWLNTSEGHHKAYKFTGTPGDNDYTFASWDETDLGYDAQNPFRNSKAFYFLPTEDEWVKAAYWNGTSLQEYATKPGDMLHQGDATSDTGWSYYADGGSALDPAALWVVGSGSEELNGTFDMMGNVLEWTESPFDEEDYSTSSLGFSQRTVRGGSLYSYEDKVALSHRHDLSPYLEFNYVGFRVASVPEPTGLLFLSMGVLALRRRKR